MSSRKTSTVAAQASTPSAQADWPRRQMALWTGGACALLRGFEAMRGMQMQAAHEALARHEQAAAKLRQPCSVTDLVALQGDLLREDTHAAAQYWQRLGAMTLELQRQAMAGLAQVAESEAEDAATTLRPNAWNQVPGLRDLVSAAAGNVAHAWH